MCDWGYKLWVFCNTGKVDGYKELGKIEIDQETRLLEEARHRHEVIKVQPQNEASDRELLRRLEGATAPTTPLQEGGEGTGKVVNRVPRIHRMAKPVARAALPVRG